MTLRIFFAIFIIFGVQVTHCYLLGTNEVCFDGLGCFSLKSPWTGLLRPFPSPTNPSDVEINLYFSSRNMSRVPIQIWPKIVWPNNLSFSSRNTTVFIIHGYLADSKAGWVEEITKNYLKNENANIFEVDWGVLAKKLLYFQAASNTRVVGAMLARFITYLVKNEALNLKKTHLIGHSLGAHVAGYTAKNLSPSKIGRITALDPAQPGFEGLPAEVRVDKSDALFVDVVHSDAVPIIPFGGFGMMKPVGDIDFYINGGNHQPGCFSPNLTNLTSITDIGNLAMETLNKWVSCSHSRAIEIFYTSFSKRKECFYVGFRINQVEQLMNSLSRGVIFELKNLFINLNCYNEDDCAILDLNTPVFPGRGSYGVITTSKEPYCGIEESKALYTKLLDKASVLIDTVQDLLPFGKLFKY